MLTPVEPRVPLADQPPATAGSAGGVDAALEPRTEPALPPAEPLDSPLGTTDDGTATVPGDRSSRTPPTPKARAVVIDRGPAAAIVLIVVGLVLLVANLSPSTVIGLLVLPTLGGIFLGWGILARQIGPLIPGGILTGLGLGILAQHSFFAEDTPAAGGVIVLGLSLGFLAILPLSMLVVGTRRTPWWPLIPGGVLSIIGTALLLGSVGEAALMTVGQFWPLALIAAGLYLLWRSNRRRGGMSQG